MKIGIDCRTITENKTGIGYYAYYLVKGLIEFYPQDYFVLFGDEPNRESLGQFEQGNVKIVIPKISRYKKFLPFIYSHLLFPEAVEKEKLDLFHGPAGTLPLTHRGRAVVTVHDLAIYKHPEWFPKGQSFSTKFVVPRSLKKASKIIAVSGATKKDLEEMRGESHILTMSNALRASHIAVIPEGVDLEKFKPTASKDPLISYLKEKFNIQLPYILFLGTLEPRKNLVRLIEAFANFSRNQAYQLVIAGGAGWYYQQIFTIVKKCNLEDQVIFTGYVNDEEKVKLLQAAEAFAFPSLYEGFGLPVLEALACGTLVVCSDNSSLPEVGGEVPVYVQATDVESVKLGLEKVLLDQSERARQQKLARAQAEKFSWHNAVAQTYKLYTELVS